MDFNDYRLFVIPDALPGYVEHNMNPSPTTQRDKTLGHTRSNSAHTPQSRHDVPVEADGPQFDLDLDESENAVGDDWSHVNLTEEGDVDAGMLSPALSPVEDTDRLARSLDFGHGSLETDLDHYSFPWQGRSRTLDDRTTQSCQTNTTEPTPISTTSEGDKLKYKLMSAWNNMKFELKPKTTFKADSPIWYLGICYHFTKEEDEMRQNGATGGNPVSLAVENFKRDFISRIWFTYRKDFPKVYGSHLTSDVGWGCMLRSGQMMLAQALVMHFLGRGWRWHHHQRKYDSVFHHQIIKFFGDLPTKECPFSLHRLVQFGVNSGKLAGDWYGPASVAHVLRDAVEYAPNLNALLHQVCLYVAQDCTIYMQDVIDMCTKPSHVRPPTGEDSRSDSGSTSSISTDKDRSVVTEDPWRAVIILVPVRLGGEALNPIYIPCLRALLAHDNCLGIIGGRPKHSLYFVGWQDDKLIHLDPHLCQDFVDVRERNFPLQTFHCMSPRKMVFTKMDPSCTLGFYCRTRADFYKVTREAQQMAAPPREKGLYPMFVFQEGRSRDLMANQPSPVQERYMRVRRLDKKGRPKGKPKEADDFVFL